MNDILPERKIIYHFNSAIDFCGHCSLVLSLLNGLTCDSQTTYFVVLP